MFCFLEQGFFSIPGISEFSQSIAITILIIPILKAGIYTDNNSAGLQQKNKGLALTQVSAGTDL